jgi:anti-sigma factor RsiW
MTTTDDPREFEHVESLLPWYASGALAPEDARRVEQALAQMPELRRRYELILEERAATATLNEGLGTPSLRARERLFARIQSDAAEAPEPKKFELGAWLSNLLFAWRPRSMALAALVAAFIAVIEAGLLGAVYFGSGQTGATYETASASKQVTEQGTFLLVAFVPEATTAQILNFLEVRKASIVQGPLAAGMFRIRVSDKALSPEELYAIVVSMRMESTIVRFVAPTL